MMQCLDWHYNLKIFPCCSHKQNAGTWTNSINWQERFKGSKPQKRVIMDEHNEKINSILKSHNREIFRVPKNGDCIYSAVCHQVSDSNPDLNPGKLRNIVCDHLIEQADYYSLFIVSNSSKTFEQKVKSEQRNNGRWNTDIADLVPSAISNRFQCASYSSPVARCWRNRRRLATMASHPRKPLSTTL